MSSVVVLTSQWAYWGERSLRDAVKLCIKGKVEIIKADEDREIRAGISRDGVVFKMPAPLVIRLLNFVGYKLKKEYIRFSDEAIYSRDKNICQYWHRDEKGRKFKYRCSTEDRTIDHVIPRCQGGTSSFKNCVCACRTCNERIKKHHSPQEAGLELIRTPFMPKLRRGDMAVITFSFDPRSKAHKAYFECFGKKFSHVVS